jgi:hypothetical protein
VVLEHGSHGLAEFFPTLFVGLVLPVSVGRLYDDVIGILNERRISFHDGLLRSQVTGENNLDFLALF